MRRLHFPELVGLRTFDTEGDMLYTSESTTTPRANAADRDYFQLSRDLPHDEVTFSAVAVSRITHRPALFIARAVRDNDDTFHGVVSASVELSYFQQLFAELDIGDHGTIEVFRRDTFTPVLRRPALADEIATPLPPSNPNRAAVTAGQTAATLEFVSTLDGILRIFSLRVLERYPFYVTVGLARQDALAGWRQRAWGVSLTSLLLLCGMGVLLVALRRADRRLQVLNNDLEQRVATRTAELEQARGAAEAASRVKSQFLATMSHELRTPLNSVIGFANRLLRTTQQTLPPRDRDYLQRIQTNGVHLLTLINTVLDLTRVEAGARPLTLTSVDLARFLPALLTQLDGQRPPTVTLQAVVPPELAPLTTDAGLLTQVLINLVGNALKFTSQGTVTVAVRVEAGTKRPLALAVQDTGIGIPPAHLTTIFEAFEQVETGLARRYEGTGLGLTIARTLCVQLGYQLEVQSVVGQGSTFTILLAPCPP